MQSATNIKKGRKEDRSLLCVPCLETALISPVLTPTYEVLESIRSLMFTVLGAMNALGGSTTKLLMPPRNIRKVGVFSRNLFLKYLAQSHLLGNLGKYLLEREKLVKENAWKLDDQLS